MIPFDYHRGIDELEQQKKKALSYLEQQVVRPEAQKVLAELAERYRRGLIANQSTAIIEKLRQADLLSYLSHYKVSEDYQLTKPDPRYFQAVFEDTGPDHHMV